MVKCQPNWITACHSGIIPLGQQAPLEGTPSSAAGPSAAPGPAPQGGRALTPAASPELKPSLGKYSFALRFW